MKELIPAEIAKVGGGLNAIQNMGLKLGLGALGLTIVAIAVAPVAVVGGGVAAVLGVGAAALGAFSGAAFAMPSPPQASQYEGSSRDRSAANYENEMDRENSTR